MLTTIDGVPFTREQKIAEAEYKEEYAWELEAWTGTLNVQRGMQVLGL